MAKISVRLVGAHEIRMQLGGKISRQRVYQITSRSDFPAPIADLAQGKVWLGADVDGWNAVHRTSPANGSPGRRSRREN